MQLKADGSDSYEWNGPYLIFHSVLKVIYSINVCKLHRPMNFLFMFYTRCPLHCVYSTVYMQLC